MRKQFSKSVLEIADTDDKSVVLIGDISHYLLKEYETKYPNRFYNLGICEQSLIGLASGMALDGMRPIVHTIAPFCIERAYEQIKIDLCYQNTDVTIISAGSSFDYSHLGCTHHCYEDVAILRALPNIQIFVPGNSVEFDALLKQTWGNGSPKYFKLSNKEHNQSFDVKAFDFNKIKHGKGNKTIFVNGHLLDEVVQSIESENSEETIIYVPSLSGFSTETRYRISEEMRGKEVFTVEENGVIGGLGDLICDIASEFNITAKIKKLGIPNKFLTNYGKPEEHRRAIGLTSENIKSLLK